jgi:hypothetical protein
MSSWHLVTASVNAGWIREAMMFVAPVDRITSENRYVALDSDLRESSVTSIILVHQVSTQKPNHNSIWLYVLITVLIDTYYIMFNITHLYR